MIGAMRDRHGDWHLAERTAITLAVLVMLVGWVAFVVALAFGYYGWPAIRDHGVQLLTEATWFSDWSH